MLFQLLQIFKWIVKIMKNENKPKKRPVSSLENHKLSKNIISWFSNRNVKQRKDTRWVFSNRVTSPSNDNVVFNDTLNNQLALLIVSLNCEQQSGSPLSHSITRCKWWVVMFKTYWYRLWWWWWWSRFTDAYLKVGFAKNASQRFQLILLIPSFKPNWVLCMTWYSQTFDFSVSKPTILSIPIFLFVLLSSGRY